MYATIFENAIVEELQRDKFLNLTEFRNAGKTFCVLEKKAYNTYMLFIVA